MAIELVVSVQSPGIYRLDASLCGPQTDEVIIQLLLDVLVFMKIIRCVYGTLLSVLFEFVKKERQSL